MMNNFARKNGCLFRSNIIKKNFHIVTFSVNYSVNKNIIVADKKENPEKIERLLKSEIMNVLKNYFDITSEDVSLSILINDDGKYDLQINAISSFLKIAHTF